jgi:hypothetical protein
MPDASAILPNTTVTASCTLASVSTTGTAGLAHRCARR